MTQSIEFMAHISIMLLGTLHLASSCSSHKAVLFGRILSCTRRWFNYYFSLTFIFESLLGDILEGVQIHSTSLEALQELLGAALLLRCQKPFHSFIGLGEFVFYLCTFRDLSFSSVESFSFHSLFTLSFRSSIHIPYTREVYRRGAYLQTPLWTPSGRVENFSFLNWEDLFLEEASCLDVWQPPPTCHGGG